ncbi:hypothetical protein JCGZ_02349 [Jatropha curcas]|uniref:Uncharacterized protein n=1 Tax=Jatropha curcas TaxID=180498 RepID=A0A067KVX6_JATCU|nr:hypothetical protein JCGZ_02349 [Jatropha curcas]
MDGIRGIVDRRRRRIFGGLPNSLQSNISLSAPNPILSLPFNINSFDVLRVPAVPMAPVLPQNSISPTVNTLRQSPPPTGQSPVRPQGGISAVAPEVIELVQGDAEEE